MVFELNLIPVVVSFGRSASHQPSVAPLSNESKALTLHVPLSRGIASSGEVPLLDHDAEIDGEKTPSHVADVNSLSLDNDSMASADNGICHSWQSRAMSAWAIIVV